MNKGLVSIIIPVFNAEKYLKRCVESILTQTYLAFELILIDDGSSDGSGKICDAYGEQYSFIHVIHIKNSGVGNARNIGLKICKGEYITFVDADDFIHTQYLEIMIEALGNHMIVCCLLFDVQEGERVLIKKIEKVNKRLILLNEMYDFSGEYAHMTCGGILYKSSLCKEMRFDTDLYVAEDTLFYHKALLEANELVFVPEKLYYYIQYPESAVHGIYDSRKFTEAVAWRRIVNLFNDYPKRIKDSCQIACSCRCVALVRRMIADKCYNKKEYEYLIEQIQAGFVPVLKSNKSLRLKINFIIWKLCPRLNLFIKKV